MEPGAGAGVQPGEVEQLSNLLAQAENPTFEWAYIDESGDAGMNGGSATYSLSCVLVPADGWHERLELLRALRRSLRDKYGLLLRDEVKANYLLRGRGDLKRHQLGDGQRRDIYISHMRAARMISSGVFAVVIDKRKLKRDRDPSQIAWEYLLQRLRVRSDKGKVPIAVIHDEGEDTAIQKLHRRFRRISWAPGKQAVQAPYLVEDPIPRRSNESYFLQLADLCAYSAYRRVVPPTGKAGSVCNELMWGELGTSVLSEVSNTRPDGLVVWPTR